MFHLADMSMAIVVGAALLLGIVAAVYVLAASVREWRGELRGRRVRSRAGTAELARRMADPTRLAALPPEAPQREVARHPQPRRSAQRPLHGAAANHVHS